MEKLLIDESSLFTNKNLRLPLCICYDVSSKVKESLLPDVDNRINDLLDFIYNNVECRSKTDVAIVTYAYSPQLRRGFELIKEGESFSSSSEKSEPDLNGALNFCVELINDRLDEYELTDVRYYQPEILLLSSGESSCDVTVAPRLICAQEQRLLSVIPIRLGDGSTQLLRELTADKAVFTDVGNFQNLFECLKKSISQVSSSSAVVCEGLKEQAINWNDFAIGDK